METESHLPEPLPATPGNSKRGNFRDNLIANILLLSAQLLIGVWLPPYLIHKLGIGVYGMIPLILSLVDYAGLLTMTVNEAVGRFLTVAVERREFHQAESIFNTALFAGGGVLILIAGIGGFASRFIANVINLPPGMEYETSLFFLCIVGAFLIQNISTPFGMSAYVRNRLSWQYWFALLGLITRVVTLVILFSLAKPRLLYVGFSHLAWISVTFIGAIIMWRVLLPELQINWRHFRLATLGSLASFGGWMIISRTGIYLLSATGIVLANRLCGSEAGGQYAIIILWANMMRVFAMSLIGLIAPRLSIYYAHGDITGLIQYTKQSIKFLSLLLMIPLGCLCGLATPLLIKWIGPEFNQFNILLIIATLPLAYSLPLLVLGQVNAASNRVKWPGIALCCAGITNVIVAWVMVRLFHTGLFGIIISSTAIYLLHFSMIIPLYTTRIFKIPWMSFHTPMIPGAIWTIFIAIGCYLVSNWLSLTTWVQLILCVCGVIVVCAPLTYMLNLTSGERRILQSFLLASQNG